MPFDSLFLGFINLLVKPRVLAAKPNHSDNGVQEKYSTITANDANSENVKSFVQMYVPAGVKSLL